MVDGGLGQGVLEEFSGNLKLDQSSNADDDNDLIKRIYLDT